MPQWQRLPQHKQLSDEVADHVRELVLSGAFGAGDPVRVDRLAETLSVSATPVREALQMLRIEGFLEQSPRRGFTVLPFSGADVLDVFRARALLSGELTARATPKLGKPDLERLEEVHTWAMQAALDGNPPLTQEHLRTFHSILYDVADAALLRRNLDNLTRFVPRSFYTDTRIGSHITDTLYSDVLDALRQRDAETARRAVETHMDRVGQAVAAYVNERLRDRKKNLS